MASETTTDNPQNAERKRLSATTVIRGFAFVLANARTYGISHNITRNAAGMVAQALAAYLREFGALTFEVKGDDFFVEGVAIDMHTPALEALARRLAELGAADLSFGTEVTREELDRWFTVLDSGAAGAPGSFGQTLASSGFHAIQSGNVTLREVAEDEDVFKKAEVEAAAHARFASRIRNAERLLDSLPDGQAMPAIPVDLSDPQAFEDLLRISQTPALSGGATPANRLADESANRLERLAQGLMAHPANRTQTGRRNLRKLLTKAESDITERLQKLGADIEAVERLASRVKRLVEDLAVDGIAARYVKLRGQAEADGARLRRRMRGAMRRGAGEGEALKGRLLGAGLTEEMVSELLASGKGGTGGSKSKVEGQMSEGGSQKPEASSQQPTAESQKPEESPSQLSELLSKLRKTDPGSGELPALVESILGEMSRSLLDTQRNANKQLETLRKIVMIPSYRTDNPKLTRQQLQSLMAELGQQLRQPLTVVNGGVGMILSGHFGAIPEAQRHIVKLIADSAAELDALVGRLIEIAGIPESLTPGEFAMPDPTSASPSKLQ
ncbi:MAG: hypothetical protein IJQ73_11520 [Kiritimatiellae bacterium]|nr:hypothetical protein [Kiritimatiellia bacterium]